MLDLWGVLEDERLTKIEAQYSENKKWKNADTPTIKNGRIYQTDKDNIGINAHSTKTKNRGCKGRLKDMEIS